MYNILNAKILIAEHELYSIEILSYKGERQTFIKIKLRSQLAGKSPKGPSYLGFKVSISLQKPVQFG